MLTVNFAAEQTGSGAVIVVLIWSLLPTKVLEGFTYELHSSIIFH
jgi:hypothetical protein